MKMRLALILLVALSTAGCGQNQPAASSTEPPASSSAAAPATESPLRFAPSPIGKIVLKWNTEDLYGKVGMPDFTGEALLAYSPDQFPRTPPETTYAIQSSPGAEQGLYLQRFPEDGRTVRATLTRVDAELQPLGEAPIVSALAADPRNEEDARHKMPFRTAIDVPQQTEALYTLVTELVEPDGTASDAIVSVVYVPGKTVNAFLGTDKDAYHAGDSMQLKIVNNGPTNLTFGRMYLLEKQDGDAWTPLNADAVWTLEGYTSTPENHSDQLVKLDGMEPGTYRISKDVSLEQADYRMTLSKTFTIE